MFTVSLLLFISLSFFSFRSFQMLPKLLIHLRHFPPFFNLPSRNLYRYSAAVGEPCPLPGPYCILGVPFQCVFASRRTVNVEREPFLINLQFSDYYFKKKTKHINHTTLLDFRLRSWHYLFLYLKLHKQNSLRLPPI